MALGLLALVGQIGLQPHQIEGLITLRGRQHPGPATARAGPPSTEYVARHVVVNVILTPCAVAEYLWNTV